MTTLAELLGDTAPLPTTTPLEDRMTDTDDTAGNPILVAAIVVAVLAALAVIVAGIVLGGPWRWAAGAMTAVLIVAIAVPGFIKSDNGNEEER